VRGSRRRSLGPVAQARSRAVDGEKRLREAPGHHDAGPYERSSARPKEAYAARLANGVLPEGDTMLAVFRKTLE
jgi:hypothetical protein